MEGWPVFHSTMQIAESRLQLQRRRVSERPKRLGMIDRRRGDLQQGLDRQPVHTLLELET